jgi:hypothetical protein
MNRIHHIRRHIAILAGLAFAWLGLAAAAPAAFAQSAMIPVPTGGGGDDAPVPAIQTVTRVVVVGGMPGWQIALIAAGAALFAAAAALLGYRLLATRRQAGAATA